MQQPDVISVVSTLAIGMFIGFLIGVQTMHWLQSAPTEENLQLCPAEETSIMEFGYA